MLISDRQVNKQLGGAVDSMWGSYQYVAPQGRRIETVLSYIFLFNFIFAANHASTSSIYPPLQYIV